MPSGGALRFGPFRLDLRSKRLLRDDEAVSLQPRQFNVLLFLLEHAGELVTKDQLMAAAWPGVIVADANLTQAVFHLRQALDPGDPNKYIETVTKVGYRFIAPVSRVAARFTDDELENMLAPHRGMMDGRAAIESLELEQVKRARSTFQLLVASDADDWTYHVGLATASALEFEATRTDAEPDVAALELALHHAREACRLSPHEGEVWATLGFVLVRAGKRADALAAHRRSITLEPDNWKHRLRFAYSSWAEERLRAARVVLELFPHCPLAYWLAATVYAARGAFAQAEREVDAGIAAAENDDLANRFAVVALHWLKGLLCLCRGDAAAAFASFERELALESRGHVYAREIAANTWYAIGACRWRQHNHELARAAFEEALSRVPRHPLAKAGLILLTGNVPAGVPVARPDTEPIEVTLARAAVHVGFGDPAGAAAVVAAALETSENSSAGWTVPIEPLLNVSQHPEVWATVLARVRSRAG